MNEEMNLDQPAKTTRTRAKTKTTRADKAHDNTGLPKRVPLSAGAKLHVPQSMLDDESFYYRWLEDKPGRISQAKQAMYEHVLDEHGNNWVYRGNPDMYLMRLPIEYRKEDIALKDQRITDTLKQEQKLGESEYIPQGKKGSLQRDEDLHDPLA